MSDNRVIVIGGGIGGLSVGIGLQRKGVPVDIYERAPEVRELGTGTGIQAVAQQGLEMLELGEAVREIGGTPFEWQILTTRSGRKMAQIPRRGEAFVVNRGELLEVFKREIDMSAVHCGAECVSFEQDGRGVTARFADGREERGAALIGADGVRSVTRQQVVGDGPPLYSGWSAWRGMFKYTHPTLPITSSEQVWGPASVFGLFPSNDRLFWWAAAVLPEGAVDSPAGRKHDAAQTYSGWPESIPDVIAATPDDQIYRGDLYHRLPVKSWSSGRVTLLGDAAHPTMPAFGQGAGMAMEDSAVLARELGSVRDLDDTAAVTAALRRYEQPRIARTSTIVNQARNMAKLCTWRNPLTMTVRTALISSLPNRLWERTYETEHSYRL